MPEAVTSALPADMTIMSSQEELDFTLAMLQLGQSTSCILITIWRCMCGNMMGPLTVILLATDMAVFLTETSAVINT